MEKHKNVQIAFITAFAIILVVVGHIDITEDYNYLWLKGWIYGFHMPLFVFVSGFLFCYTTTSISEKYFSLTHFLLKKSRRLLLPFVVINTIIFLFKTIFATDSYVKNPVTLSWGSYIDSMLFHPIGFMWFLPALFVIFAMSVLIARKLSFRMATGWILIAILFFILSHFIGDIHFFQISNAIGYTGYFIAGIIYCIRKPYWDKILFKYPWWGIIVWGGLSALVLEWKVVAAFIGILFALSLSLAIRDKVGDKVIRFSSFSFTIYLLSYFPQMLIRGPVFHHFPGANEYIFSVLSVLSGIFFPLLVGYLVFRIKGKNRWTRLLANAIGL